MPAMDDTDRNILNRIQSRFPITAQPFEALAQELSLTETEVIERVRKMKAAGLIRRIGGNFVPEKLGYVSTLCAAQVAPDKIDGFAWAVNRYPGVTHNYVRRDDFNVWFTFIAPSMDHIQSNLAAISKATGVQNILNLPATRVFKIKAKFNV